MSGTAKDRSGRTRGTRLCIVAALTAMSAPLIAGPTGVAYQRALGALGERDIPAVIAGLEEALPLAATPDDEATVNMLLGLCYRWEHESDKGIEAYQAVLRHDPDMVVDLPEQRVLGLNAQTGLGLCYYYGKGDLAAAISWWEKRLRVNPDAERVAALLLRARRELGQVGQLTAPPMVFVGGKYLPSTVKESEGHLLVPAGDLGRLLGSKVALGAEDWRVEFSSEAHTLVLSVGSKRALVDGKPMSMLATPVVVEGEHLVPLRSVAEALGREVRWEPAPRVAWVR